VNERDVAAGRFPSGSCTNGVHEAPSANLGHARQQTSGLARISLLRVRPTRGGTRFPHSSHRSQERELVSRAKRAIAQQGSGLPGNSCPSRLISPWQVKTMDMK
jgi:hypothetical protein